MLSTFIIPNEAGDLGLSLAQAKNPDSSLRPE